MTLKENVIEAIEKEKIIVIVRGVAREKIMPLVDAMYKGGIRLLEITFDSTGKVSDEETATLIQLVSEAYKDKMYIGAGTVLTKEQVELVKNAGGKFIISPNTNEEVIKKTIELDLVSMPGALTPSEIQSAHLYGADFVKLFPITNFGPEYVKAVKAPLSHIKFTAVGGINEKNMMDYVHAGVSGFGVGTNIVDKNMLSQNDFDGITELAKKYINAIK